MTRLIRTLLWRWRLHRLIPKLGSVPVNRATPDYAAFLRDLEGPMIARDRQGRRYLEIRPFDDGPLKTALAELPEANHRCVECRVLLVHGNDRYFQRNDPTDDVLLLLTYDPVCGPCGDQALAALATN